MTFSDDDAKRAAEWERRNVVAPCDLTSATAFLHEVCVCGASTGHSWRTIALCDSEARAKIVAAALCEYADKRASQSE